jgi:Tfp pilus assembly protein PilZ
VFCKPTSEARVLLTLGADLSLAGTAILNALLNTPEMVVITGKVSWIKAIKDYQRRLTVTMIAN